MSRLGLLGLSMGGMMAALSVAHHPFAALCLWAPAHPKLWLREHHGKPLTDQQLQKSFKAAIKEARLPQVRLHPGGLDWNGNPMSFKFFHDLNRHQPLKTITAHTGPALVVHGTADPAVPLEVGQLYAGAIKARFHPIQDGLHTFEVLPHQEEVYRVTLGFFEKELKGKAEKPKAKG
jgi:dipeptidyl aminopeptidase/acylaminoacyl peptidase